MSRQSQLLGFARAILGEAAKDLQPAVFTTSFGAEDMVLLDLIANEFPDIHIATLDTGRLPETTYEVWNESLQRYGVVIEAFYPVAESVEAFVNLHGINGFRDSVALRKACCHVRKVEPLERALAGRRAWITGLRREQATTRDALSARSTEARYGLIKLNPLVDWSETDVWEYIRSRDVPYNSLHDRHYPSIGCAPCTRAITPGEDIRAGRWWWEGPVGKECGLHAPGRPVITLELAGREGELPDDSSDFSRRIVS